MKTMTSTMMRFALPALALLTLSACGPATDRGSSVAGDEVVPNDGHYARSDKLRDMDPDVAPADLTELVDGNSGFAFDLYRQLATGSTGNLFYSPHSISLALAMAYGGARNDTEEQMALALRYTLPQERLHPSFNALDLALASRGEGALGMDGEGFRLKIANASWGQTGYGFLEGYLDLLAINYGAGMRLVDFRNATEEARQAINAWVSEQTEGRIEELLMQGDVTPLTALVLTNTIFFSAAWAHPFAEELTAEAPFTLLSGAQVDVPTMTTPMESFDCAEGDGFAAVQLPYDGDEVAMLVLVPDSGRFAEIEGALDADLVDAIVADLEPHDIMLTMPKWQSRTRAELSEALQALGMIAPFDGADFSGMTGARDLFITSILHEATITVNESGTEAAAATAVVMGYGLPDHLVVDRPFIYLIRDLETGAILFAGRVLDPSA